MLKKMGALSASVYMMLKNAKQSNAVCVNKVSTEYTPPPGRHVHMLIRVIKSGKVTINMMPFTI